MASQKLQAVRASAVTPSNTVNISSINGGVANGCTLYIGGAGAVKVTTLGGDAVTFSAVPAGTFMPIQVLRVWATGTTATNILALW